MYHNTTNETGDNLSRFKDAAQKQETQVFEFYKIYGGMTASQVWKFFRAEPVPLTSIRRAITNLTYQGLLVKTSEKRIGLYNRPETIYRVVEHDWKVQCQNLFNKKETSKQLALAL